MNQALSQYYIFYVAARCGNISRASRELFISQPAVSKSIRKLEQSLHTVLFRRGPRGVLLTEDGELLYRHVSEAFASLETAEQSLERKHALGISHLRIGASTTLCKYVLLPYLQRFIQLHPHVKITITCQSTYRTLALLQEEKIDVGLVGRPASLKGCEFRPLQSIQDTFVATAAYLSNLSLREAGSSLFHTATFMMLDEENITRQFINNYFQEQGIELRNILEISTMDLLIEFARIGMGAACVIREFVQADLDGGNLVEVPLGIRFPAREIGFAWTKESRELAPVREFLELPG
ncbi:MAG TPA: LysR family transcriptional regulator [Candidatus Scatomonas pullistercoris]|uniref:LysR family transcriptional regulator n=1 Tax=Candidatus Scatomonas pullistercoris TaxID=2840920 RepID=A0A9D1P0P6_9FIRM|nr:LysR family transcriptional regulator [Candidatus Scatomonas pullistercoris]